MSVSKSDRKIFRYWNGTRKVGIDPLEADIAIEAVDLDWEAKITLARVGDKEAIQDIIAAARKVFGLPTLEIADDDTETGLTSVEVIEILTEFMLWKRELQGFTEPPQTGPEPTAATGQSTVGVSSPTASGTDSTSTSGVKSPATVSS